MGVQHFEITGQVDGITDTFTTPGIDIKDDSNFMPVLNGQVVNILDVTKIDSKTFKLDCIPQVGDTLEVRYQDRLTDVTINCIESRFELPIEGEVFDLFQVDGEVITTHVNIKGRVLKVVDIDGELPNIQTISGDINKLIEIDGEIKC